MRRSEEPPVVASDGEAGARVDLTPIPCLRDVDATVLSTVMHHAPVTVEMLCHLTDYSKRTIRRAVWRLRQFRILDVRSSLVDPGLRYFFIHPDRIVPEVPARQAESASVRLRRDPA